MPESFVSKLIANIVQRGRELFSKQVQMKQIGHRPDIVDLCSALLSRRGEASGVALASQILHLWDESDNHQRKQFLLRLVRDFGPPVRQLENAIAEWNDKRDEAAVRKVHVATEPKRQELIRRLNLAPEGTRRLVTMREELFLHRREFPELDALDTDFFHLFSSWFNRGFLVLMRIDWNTSANILEKIIRYEAVHAIDDWTELRRRIEPDDRRLFAFFHPQMLDEPLIFVEVALTDGIPDGIQVVLDPQRSLCRATAAKTAVFYSISNCQQGLKGVSFGNFLIKQVVEELKRELPNLNRFVTLSPVPGFRRWLAQQKQDGKLPTTEQDVLSEMDSFPPGTRFTPQAGSVQFVERRAAEYFLNAKDARGKPLDPVARFHLGNGARLERLNPFGDWSSNGMQQSYGLMVNYLYDLGGIEVNHEAYEEKNEVISSALVRNTLHPAAHSGAVTSPQHVLA
jgi:malonyl-CoA decarboxylase